MSLPQVGLSDADEEIPSIPTSRVRKYGCVLRRGFDRNPTKFNDN